MSANAPTKALLLRLVCIRGQSGRISRQITAPPILEFGLRLLRTPSNGIVDPPPRIQNFHGDDVPVSVVIQSYARFFYRRERDP
jgi:hypothetical protein